MKNHINFCRNIVKSPYFLPLISLFFLTVTFCITNRTLADNAVLRSIFSCQAQGLGGAIPQIKVWYQNATNLSFIPAGETIKKVWLDDPSQVTLDFDGPMCLHFGGQGDSNADGGDCENSAASVIHMRRIEKLDIPNLPPQDNSQTLLTVVTEGGGKRKLYTFRVIYGEGMPEYNTMAVFPDPPSSSETPCVQVDW